jgi:hypothetical protein
MENDPDFFTAVDDDEALNFDLEEQVLLVHDDEGIQRSDEPAR